MANRSDFLGPLPRQIKRMLSLGAARGWIKNLPEQRRLFAAAHRSAQDAKFKRPAKDDAITPEGGSGTATIDGEV